MQCPNCQADKLLTIETFQTVELVYRTRKCAACLWKFTTHETFADEQSIPRHVRQRGKSLQPAGK